MKRAFILLFPALVYLSLANVVPDTIVMKQVYEGKEFIRVDIPSPYSVNQEVQIASYYISNFATNWTSARSVCTDLIGKKLVSLNSREKNNEVKSAIIAAGISANAYHTSGIFNPQTDALIWDSNGANVIYSNFYDGCRPNFGLYPLIIINTLERNWYNSDHSNLSNFICE